MNLIFGPKSWHSCDDHDAYVCVNSNNCYSYILDRPDYKWSVPGFGYSKKSAQEYFEDFNNLFAHHSGVQFREALILGAERDGLIRISEITTKNGYYIAALVFADDNSDHDFHWYRQDDDGNWSHKNGWKKVSQFDDENRLIKNPLYSTRKEFPNFGSYFLVPHMGVDLQNNFPATK